MTLDADLADIRAFLPCATPQAWLQRALAEPALLLIDHANCEKKAASTALNLIYRYVENTGLLLTLSKLAREELRHFEQVVAMMRDREVEYRQITASRYASDLRQAVRTHEPERLMDTLLVGAIIEARSCERFAVLAPALDDELAAFYNSLLKSEARHFKDYLRLAEAVTSPEAVRARLPELLAREQWLIESPDPEFRFHSGLPQPSPHTQ